MKRALLLGACCLFLTGCTPKLNDASSTKEATATNEQTVPEAAEPTSATSTSDLPAEFTAQFKITTNGTERIFTDQKYHNLSADVFIESEKPDVIQVKRLGVTWKEFFATLPMSLTQDCLTTGTGQTFCTNESSELKFWLNGGEAAEVLEQNIQPNDFLLVEYRVKE